MADKPSRASEYSRNSLELVRSTLLFLATRLGDLGDDLVLVGGLVPSLLIDQARRDAHVGTRDVDLGLALAVLDDERYHELARRLRDAGLEPDLNEKGQTTRQRWRLDQVTVDFLIPPAIAGARGGRLQSLEPDLAAIVTPGLDLAFRDRERRTLDGRTIRGEKATRDLWVCGAGAFLVLKALAFEGRGENKDAYDLYYLLRHYGTALADVTARLRPLLEAAETQRALAILTRDFTDLDAVGARRLADFLETGPNQELQADFVGLVIELLADVDRAAKV
jgi:Nucleotidyl transferase AbiEii toxin, Type IV TA system